MANPKTYPTDLSCDDVVSVDQVSSSVGADMKPDQYAVDAYQFQGSSARCAWSAVDSRNDRSSAILSATTWYDQPLSSDEEAFMFNGNSALRQTITDSCHVTVAIQADKAIEIEASNQHGSACELAESLMKIAFDNLPDA